MHELSLIEGMLDILKQEQKKHSFERVLSIELECGSFNCLSEESLQFYFDLAVTSTPWAGARIKVHREHPHYNCSACHAKIRDDFGSLKHCPQCKKKDTLVPDIQHGIRFRNIEVE